MEKYIEFDALVGKTLSTVTVDRVGDGYSDEIVFTTECGHTFKMYHMNSCCESVGINDITGDIYGLVGKPILTASVTSDQTSGADYLEAWTFYHISTFDEWITIRWYGSSNGYYSVGVDFVEIV